MLAITTIVDVKVVDDGSMSKKKRFGKLQHFKFKLKIYFFLSVPFSLLNYGTSAEKCLGGHEAHTLVMLQVMMHTALRTNCFSLVLQGD